MTIINDNCTWTILLHFGRKKNIHTGPILDKDIISKEQEVEISKKKKTIHEMRKTKFGLTLVF